MLAAGNNRKALAIALVVAAVLVLAASGGYYIYQKKKQAKTAQQPMPRQYDLYPSNESQLVDVPGVLPIDIQSPEGVATVENLLMHSRAYSLDPDSVSSGFFQVQL